MCGVNSTEFSHLTAGNFEKSLASDELLVHFFNNFLSLPTFPESLVYNQETGLFEVATGAAGFVSSRIQSVLHYSKSQFLTGDPAVLARTPPVDNNYSVSCLNREQGFQWVVKERLPFFLQSDYYSEYRLAKLFHQNLNLCIQRRKYSTGTTDYPVTGLPSGQKEPINTKCCASPICSSSLSDPEKPCPASCLLSTSSSSCPNIKFEKAQELQRPQIVPSLGNPQDEHVTDSSSQPNNSSEVQLERLAVTVVKQVLHNSLTVMDGQCLANTSESFFSLSGDNAYCTSTIKSCECNIFLQSANGVQDREKMREEKVQKDKRHTGVEEKTELEKKDWKEEGRGRYKKTVFDCCHGILCHSSRLGLDEFKEFLRGTQGEKMFSLWMDIERLKCTQNRQRKNRYLALMRSWYLLSSSHSCLNVELLARLGLTTPPCWTEEKLHSVQPILTEALLYYWAPRFWSSPYVHDEDTDDPSHVGVWADWCVSPLSGVQSHYDYLTMHPADHENCNPQSPDTILTQFHSGRGQSLGSRRIENLLQALSVDMCAGSYITTFCEQSGNQLWENAINCWTDLQHYRELFYHDGLDPYRVQREAQLLYSTYLLTSARRTIDVDDEMRREAYSQMTPAFEELFDSVEEHILSILLEPWTLLVNRDKGSLQKVCVWEEVRCVESREYRELQCLYEELERRLKQMEQWDSVILHSSVTPSRLHSKGPTVPDSWANVPPNYHGYRLGSILRYPDEISHFMSFLQDKGASIHLSCWLDLDRYRRTSQKGEAVRQERSSFIATKYLNRKYFFGSDSPATVQQQNDILHLAGGLERLTLDCLPNSVVIEIQNIIRSHIEEKWLPLFLSTTEFTERRKQQLKCQAADGASQHVHRRRRARTAAWKHGGLWMTSSKEILLFRRTLLNPVTCLQFQHFVALKGEFLENDVLFWLEVQRYKDLCHSHSDDLTIQKKISTIINCFINSSLPPALQIDIPPEQALHILEKRKELGPYIFREAQMSVFSELLKLWPEFQELSSRVQEEQLLPLLQEKRVKHRARVRRQRRKEEEAEEEEESERRRAQAELVRPKSSGAAGEEEERDQEDEEVNIKEKRQLKAERSRTSPTQTQPLSWSYSKYMAALKREEELLRRQNQPEASFSMALDSSSDCSIKSAGSNVSRLQPLRRPTDGKQRDRYNRGVRVCNNQRVK